MKKENWFIKALGLVIITILVIGCTTPTAAPTSPPEVAPTEVEAAPAQPEQPEEVVEVEETKESIRFLAYPWFTLSEDALKVFTEQTGIEVIQETLGYEELNTKVSVSSAAGVPPADVFSTYVVPLSGHVSAGFVAQLDEFLSDELKEDLLGLDVFRFDGKLMGVPTYYDVVGMVVNNDMLTQAGVDKIPESIEELNEVALKIKEAGAADYPLVIPMAAQSGTASRWELFSLALSGEPLFDEDYNPLFTDENSGGYKALKFMVESVGVTIDPALVELIDLDVHDVFLAGKGAFIFSSSTVIQDASNPEISAITGAKVTSELVPGSEFVRSAALNFYLDGMAISKFSENKEGAWKFLEWWFTEDAAKIVWEELAIAPTRSSLLDEYVSQGLIPGGDFVFRQSEYGLSIFAGGIPPWFEEFEIEAASQINQAARGSITVDEAVQNIADLAIKLKQ